MPHPFPEALTVRDILHLLTAARSGNPEAGFVLGLAHEYGLGGLPVDAGASRRWYRQTACLSPRETSACCQRRAIDPSTRQLHQQALGPTFRRAYLEAQASDPYARSFGADAIKTPFRWYARQTIAPEARAEFAMARAICLDGEGTDWSPAPWFRRAAEGGVPEAALQLGLMLRCQAIASGSACAERRAKEAFTRAKKGLTRLAKRGQREAWYQLGVLLVEGWSGSPAPEAGARWLARAAAVGHVESQARLRCLQVTEAREKATRRLDEAPRPLPRATP